MGHGRGRLQKRLGVEEAGDRAAAPVGHGWGRQQRRLAAAEASRVDQALGQLVVELLCQWGMAGAVGHGRWGSARGAVPVGHGCASGACGSWWWSCCASGACQWGMAVPVGHVAAGGRAAVPVGHASGAWQGQAGSRGVKTGEGPRHVQAKSD